MGVMSCSRKGCPEIMCQTYIDGIGHICYDCQKEFQEVMGEDAELSEQHMYEQLKAFMTTEPRHPHGGSEQVTVSQFFNKYKRE